MSAYKETLLFTTQKISPKTWTTKNIITITNSSLNEFPVSSWAFIRVSVLMVLHALQEVLEGLSLTWDGEPATMIKPKFLLSLLQQYFEKGVAEVASGNDEPPKLRSNINRQVPFGNICWRFGTLAVILVRITNNIC